MSERAIFNWPVRGYFQDTDAGGVVYHASYVNFMERARTEWLRACGYSNAGLMKEFGVMFVVRTMKLDYLKPAELDDMLNVTAQVMDIGRSRLTLQQSVRRHDELLTTGEVHLVCVSRQTFRPVRVPDALSSKWKI